MPGDQYLYVNISYDFRHILYIDEVENFMRITYNLQKDWYSSLLTFQNLKRDTDNLIFEEDKKNIYVPWLVSKNVENEHKVQKTDSEEIFKVVPNQDFVFKYNSKSHYQNAFLFEERTYSHIRNTLYFINIKFYFLLRDPKITFHKTGHGHQIIFAILNMNGSHLTLKVVTLISRFWEITL